MILAKSLAPLVKTRAFGKTPPRLTLPLSCELIQHTIAEAARATKASTPAQRIHRGWGQFRIMKLRRFTRAKC
jgi:hypothetical protein